MTSEPLPPGSISLEQAMQEAVQHHREGRLAQAQQLYGLILQAQPAHAPASHNMGVLAVQGGTPAAGLAYFRQALASDPNQPTHWVSYIDALIQAGHPALANDVLAQGRRAGLKGPQADGLSARISVGDTPEPEEINALVMMFNENMYAEIEEPARVLSKLYPDQGLVWKLWGTARAMRGEAALALEPLQQAAIWLPQDADVRINLGNALKAHGQLTQAEAAYREALALNPEAASAHGALGNLYRQQGQLALAQACYEQALALQPALAGARQNMGVVLAEQGRLDQAQAAYEAALAARPDFIDAYINLATLLQNTGRLGEARSWLDRGLAAVPSGQWMLASLALTGCWIEGDCAATRPLLQAWLAQAQTEEARLQDAPLREFFLLAVRLLAAREQLPQLYAGEGADAVLDVLGESHCMAAAHANFAWQGAPVRGRSRLVKGVKMHHLAVPGDNQYKASLARQLDSLPEGASLLLAIGEIDCRPLEGIWPAAAKGKGALPEIVAASTQGYLAWVQAQLQGRPLSAVALQGVPAPACSLDMVNDKASYLAMVRDVNAALKAGAARRGWKFLDVYAATAAADGTSTRRWHIDDFHLHPAFYAQAQQWLA
ncbi:MAG: tetratricopeptide repeat protein [Burkholderiales bacterium]|nr:tetratricopeptide repeat protein [Burkholderiales bacterium]